MKIHIPTPLRNFTDGKDVVLADGNTIEAALESLVATHPGVRNNLFGADGKLRSFVNIYLNEDDVRYLPNRDQTAVKDSDELTIIPSIAGGR